MNKATNDMKNICIDEIPLIILIEKHFYFKKQMHALDTNNKSHYNMVQYYTILHTVHNYRYKAYSAVPL